LAAGGGFLSRDYHGIAFYTVIWGLRRAKVHESPPRQLRRIFIGLGRIFGSLLGETLRAGRISGGVASTDWPAMHTGLQASCLLVSGAGGFKVRGLEGEDSLSGKKLVADAYWPHVPIGGALSSMDLFRADRAIAIMARRLATKRS
jgi:hypothetical protein